MVGEERPLLAAIAELSFPGSASVEGLFRSFEDMVENGLEKKHLRRLDVERLISQHVAGQLGAPLRNGSLPNLYRQVEHAADNNPRDPTLFACRFLLNATSTVYQVYHAYQFGALGGLFPAHDRGLIDAGLYQYLTTSLPLEVLRSDPGAEEDHPARSPVLFGSLDVSKFTHSQIVEIRKSEEFGEYVSRLSKWKQPAGLQTAYDANPDFVEYLRDFYLPFLKSREPRAVWIGPTIKGVTTAEILSAGVILALSQTPALGGVLIGNRAVVTGITAVAGAVRPYSEEIARSLRFLQTRKRSADFMNQYWS
jgi:hypothetical protein